MSLPRHFSLLSSSFCVLNLYWVTRPEAFAPLDGQAPSLTPPFFFAVSHSVVYSSQNGKTMCVWFTVLRLQTMDWDIMHTECVFVLY